LPKFSLVNKEMKKSIDIKLIKFYLWASLAYATIWLIGHLSTFQGTFLQSVGNNLWRVAYLIVVNFIFLEYTVPFVIRKKRFLIYNILLGILALWVHSIPQKFANKPRLIIATLQYGQTGNRPFPIRK
jgi:hypothetical protein